MPRQILHTHIIKNRSFELNKLVLRYHNKEMPYSSSLGLTIRTPKGSKEQMHLRDFHVFETKIVACRRASSSCMRNFICAKLNCIGWIHCSHIRFSTFKDEDPTLTSHLTTSLPHTTATMTFMILKIFSTAFLLAPILAFQTGLFHFMHREFLLASRTENHDSEDSVYYDARRSFLIAGGLSTVMSQTESANAAKWLGRKSGLYVIDDTSDAVPKEQVDTPIPTLSSEYALLKMLPVKNPVFRMLEQNIETLSVLRLQGKC
jgi:hypothetical protein